MNAFERIAYKQIPIVLLAMALYAAGARAADPATPMFSFSGFGTSGVVHSSENRADFASNAFKPNGAGHSHDWSADVDSRIAAQVTANFTRQISAVLQVISEQRYDNSYTPAVEWANIKYQFTPDFSVRAGRIVLPGFLVSDYRKVGYANPWVRPPVEFYAQLPVNNSDGVDVTYRAHIGDLTSTVQGTYGRTETGIPGGRGTANAKDLRGITYTGEYGAVTAHLAYLRANVTVESFKPLFDGFRRFGAEGIALADKYDYNNKPYTLFGLGGMYNPRDWFVMGEWAVSDRRSVVGDRMAWYASGGYRLGKFTPYLTYAQVDTYSPTSDPGLTLSGLPPVLAGPAAGLNAGLNDLLASSPAQKTISAGVRWDFAKNAALKLQFDQTRLGAGSPGMLINLQPGFQPGGKVNVFSATIDFVF